MTNVNEIKVGDEVTVGPKFVMADHAPFIGRGRFEADEWTGRRMLVVKVSSRDADLAPTGLVGADETDAVVSIVLRRLSR